MEILILLTVVGRVQPHPRQELLEHDRHLLEALVVLDVVLDQLAARDSQVGLLLDNASVRYTATLLCQVVMWWRESLVHHAAEIVFLFAGLVHIVVEGNVDLELGHLLGDLLLHPFQFGYLLRISLILNLLVVLLEAQVVLRLAKVC